MYEDEPQDRVHDVLAEAIYGDHPLGRRVLGRAEVIGGIPVPDIAVLPRRSLHGLQPRRRGRRARRARADRRARRAAARRRGAERRRGRPGDGASEQARLSFYPKETEQYHICFGGPGIARADERRFALGVLDTIFGGSVSSRLFREVREKRGLAYSVGSYTHEFVDRGFVAMYVGTRGDNVAEACEIIGRELVELRDGGCRRGRARAGQGARQGPHGARARGDRGADGPARPQHPLRHPAALARRDARARRRRQRRRGRRARRARSTTRRSSPPPASAPTRSCFRTAAGSGVRSALVRVIRVVVSGAAGRMGETVCEAVEGADDLELIGRADPQLGTDARGGRSPTPTSSSTSRPPKRRSATSAPASTPASTRSSAPPASTSTRPARRPRRRARRAARRTSCSPPTSRSARC